ncbi:MAG: ABC transporter substrate-binding protein [Anaerolineaceae bacterium]|nr:ABC transporter substrate-binding protein [Anaerolineaceae bacterium]
MKRLLTIVTLLLISTLILSACGISAVEVSEKEAEEVVVEAEEVVVEAEEEAEAEEAAPMGYYDRALAGEFAGTVVSIFGAFTEQDEVKFNDSLVPFEEATGIDVQYESSKEFEATISIRVDAGNAPDIADFPQPGLMANFARAGDLVNLQDYFSMDYLQGQYLDSWIDMSTIDDNIVGVWHRFNIKSLVWYPKDDFEASGYEIPETWDELIALSDQIVADGDTPWCIGIESGVATGWPATDWMEEIMLRTTSLENYDKWSLTGELPFSSPEVMHAAEVMSSIWLNDDYVYGGREQITTTFFGDAPTPMFEDPPKCWLHKQGNFITSFFPEGAVGNVDYGVFYFPPIDDTYGKPLLAAGDIMSAFSDRPEVLAVMEYFTRGDCLKTWLAAGGALSPHKDSSLDWYGNEMEKEIAGLAAEATSVRYDGSDLMPGEVGTGSFWTGITSYISGASDLKTIMAEIDASWPH